MGEWSPSPRKRRSPASPLRCRLRPWLPGGTVVGLAPYSSRSPLLLTRCRGERAECQGKGPAFVVVLLEMSLRPIV
jgi:hypothetical protein